MSADVAASAALWADIDRAYLHGQSSGAAISLITTEQVRLTLYPDVHITFDGRIPYLFPFHVSEKSSPSCGTYEFFHFTLSSIMYVPSVPPQPHC